MRITVEQSQKKQTLKDIAVSVPKSIYSTAIFGKDVDTDGCCVVNCSNNFELTQMLTQQHPLINTWLILSLVSICSLFTLLFFIH